MSPELERLCELLRAAAEREISPRFGQAAFHRKPDGSLVTETDFCAQRHIAAGLERLYPQIPLLGEETSAEEQRRRLADAEPGVWCLDPLDGTTNFACGFPSFGVSLALLRGEAAVLGAILDPVRRECFCAERGGGAFLNGEPLSAGCERSELGDCLALVDLKRLPVSLLSRLGADAPFLSQRNLGSVALDWCWLAAGRGQLYLHGGQRLWDYAAGRLIATEAGIPSRLLDQDGAEPASGLALEPRMAIAAANDLLLGYWMDWLGLPRSDQDSAGKP